MYRRILVPIDGSPTAQRGLEEAIQLAKVFGASIELLSIVDLHPMALDVGAGVAWDKLFGELRAQLQKVLDTAQAAVRSAGLACEAQLDEAVATRVCDLIVDRARNRQCDLIVMGTHGRRGLAHALIGSDAERVLRHAPCAVLLVRVPAKADGP